MTNITKNQRIRAIRDRRTLLINELYKLDYQSSGKSLEEMTLVELEQIHINEKCRAAAAYGERG